MNSKNKKTKILIPNASSPRNIGDQAILESLLSVIRNNFHRPDIVVHSIDPYLQKEIDVKKIGGSAYYWAVFENLNPFIRVSRVIQLAIAIVSKKLFNNYPSPFINPDLNAILKDYELADLIIYTGGGYLRSKAGLFQSLNLIMNLMFFWVGKTFNKSKIIIAPISFGPFAYKWQARVSALIIKNQSVVMVRESASCKILKHYGVQCARYSDLAFLIPTQKKILLGGQKTIGFTIREWLPWSKQISFEKEFALAISNFSKKYDFKVQPIIQVNAPDYSEDDAAATKRVVAILNTNNANIMKTEVIKNVNGALSIYARIDLLVGMRMHSNILAATQNTPFVAICYEHKTESIMGQLGAKNLCINCDSLAGNNLLVKLEYSYNNRAENMENINEAIEKMRDESKTVWPNIFKVNSMPVLKYPA